MTENPLIAKKEQEQEDERPKYWSGAGVVDSIEDVNTNLFVKFDPVALGIDAVGLGLDVAGLVADPFGTVLSSVIGWIIENVGWVREPFDALAGNPDEIGAVATTWENIEVALASLAGEHKDSLGQIAGWSEGPGTEAYREHADMVAKLIAGMSLAAGSVSNKIKLAGMAVATTRALLRDLLADLASTLLLWGIPAAAAAVPTLGASIATFITRAVTKAIEVGTKIAKALSKLFKALDKLGAFAKRGGEALAKMGDDAGALAKASSKVMDTAGTAASSAGRKLDDIAQAGIGKAAKARDAVNANAPDLAATVGRRLDDVARKATIPGPKTPSNKMGTSRGVPDRTGRKGAADKIDQTTSRGALSGENVARAIASGDLGHLKPKLGDVVYPAKELTKEAHKADVFGLAPEEKNTTDTGKLWRVTGTLDEQEERP